jgi:hypothetical protein
LEERPTKLTHYQLARQKRIQANKDKLKELGAKISLITPPNNHQRKKRKSMKRQRDLDDDLDMDKYVENPIATRTRWGSRTKSTPKTSKALNQGKPRKPPKPHAQPSKFNIDALNIDEASKFSFSNEENKVLKYAITTIKYSPNYWIDIAAVVGRNPNECKWQYNQLSKVKSPQQKSMQQKKSFQLIYIYIYMYLL